MSATLQTEVTIPSGFVTRERTEVHNFLRRHPEAAGVLPEALPYIHDIFGKVPVSLRVIHDPDSAGAEDLFAFIQVPSSSGSALQKLDAFDEGWWMGRLAGLSLPLHFDLEYV